MSGKEINEWSLPTDEDVYELLLCYFDSKITFLEMIKGTKILIKRLISFYNVVTMLKLSQCMR